MNVSLLLTREAVIVLGVIAAICATIGSWMRIKHHAARKVATLLIYGGYFFLGSSVLIYVILGFQ